MFPFQLRLYVESARHRIIDIRYQDAKICYEHNPTPKAPEASALALVAMQNGLSAITEMYVMGHFLLEGPKFFSFDARDCEALEHFDLDLPSSEYAQPFPTLMIKLPSDYAQHRIVPFEHGQHKPTDIIIRHDRAINRIMILMRMSSTQVLTRIIRLDQPNSIEEAWKESCRLWEGEEKTLDVNKDEEELSDALCRLALSANLMSMVYGTRRVGPDNPSHFDRLQRHLKVATKSRESERIARATWEVETLPIRYSFSQEVKLYKTERHEEKERGMPTGKHVKPHWRRGHFREQRHGIGLTQVKRIAIAAVLVNADYFLGDKGASSASYEVK